MPPLSVKIPDVSKWPPRQRLLAALSLAFIGFVVLDRLVFASAGRHSKQMQEEIVRRETSLRAAKRLLSRKPQIIEAAELYHEQLRYAQGGPKDMASLLTEIEGLGAESGVLLGEVKPLAESVNELYRELGMDVEFTGSLPQAVHFIYLVQTSKMMFALERASLAVKEQGSDQLQGTLRLTKQYLIQPQGAGT